MKSSGLSKVFDFLLICSLYLLRINLDFWNDELYTLEHFVLVPLSTTLGDYHVPNNHIFFNLLNNLYLKLIGLHEIRDLLPSPWKLRILPFAYALALFYVVYFQIKRSFSSFTGMAVLLLIAGTIPYFNFVTQIRGYGLSALLLVAAFLYSLRYFKEAKRSHLFIVGLASALCIYSVLSNSYSIFCLHAFLLLYYGLSGLRNKDPKYIERFKAFGLMSIVSAILCIGLYLPVLEDIVSSKYLQISTPFLLWQIEYYLPHLWEGWISGRVWLFVMIPISIIILFIKSSSKLKPQTLAQNRTHTRTSLTLTLALTLILSAPLISYIRGDQAPLRTFIPLFPFFGIGLGILIGNSFERMPKFSYKLLSIIVLAGFSIYSFYMEYQAIHRAQALKFANEVSRQDLYHQFYNASYFPLKATEEFAQRVNLNGQKLLILGCQEHGIRHYLDLYQIPYIEEERALEGIDELKAINAFEEVEMELFIVTNNPNQIPFGKAKDFEQLSDSVSYHTFIKYKNH